MHPVKYFYVFLNMSYTVVKLLLSLLSFCYLFYYSLKLINLSNAYLNSFIGMGGLGISLYNGSCDNCGDLFVFV